MQKKKQKAEKPLKIYGTFEDVLKVSVSGNPKPNKKINMSSMKDVTIEDLKGIWKGKEYSFYVSDSGSYELSDLVSAKKPHYLGKSIKMKYDSKNNVQKLNLEKFKEITLHQIVSPKKIRLKIGNKICDLQKID